MPKVSYPMSVMVGLVGPKVKSTGDTDGYEVNILCNIINPVSIEKAEYLTNHVLSLDREKILSITSLSDFEGEYEDYSDCLALPGAIS